MNKSFQELLENYKEFIEILQTKVDEFCSKTGKYNAFKDVDNYFNLKIDEDCIYIDVRDGEDYFDYQFPLHEFTLNEKDIELYNLRLDRKKIEVLLSKEECALKEYITNLNKFVGLANIYGINTQYDTEKVAEKQNEFNVNIKNLENTLNEINFKIKNSTQIED